MKIMIETEMKEFPKCCKDCEYCIEIDDYPYGIMMWKCEAKNGETIASVYNDTEDNLLNRMGSCPLREVE